MADELHLPPLIFPSFEARISSDDGRLSIYDPVRRQRVALTPEEWVRQHCINWFLMRGYPLGRCSVERVVDERGQRFDVLWRDADLAPFVLIECKAYDVALTHAALRQSAWYNLKLNAPYMFLTNGRVAHCARVSSDGAVDLLDDIPPYPAPSP